MSETLPNVLERLVLSYWPYAAALALGWLAASIIWAWRNNVNVRRAFENGLQQGAQQQATEKALMLERLEIRSRDATRLGVQLELTQRQLDQANVELRTRENRLQELQRDIATAQTRLEEHKRGFLEKEALFKENSTALKQEFEILAQRVFERQGEAQQNKLTDVLTPFREQITDFRKRVEDVYHTETKDRASILSEVRNLQRASERINKEAENLTRALKGDKKLQGNWGELVLERVLEDSGLRAGTEYFLQQARRTATGDLKRPDVLIRLPENKDVVIDAKVSLNAYEDAIVAEEDSARQIALQQFLLNLRNHVKRLADQDYGQLDNVRSLDFVLLFIPIESAFTLAMEEDPKLFSDAFKSKIVLVSPTTLMMTLRIIHNLWRYEKQNRNAEEIARRAGALYDKLRGVVEDMEMLGRQLDTVSKTYRSANIKLVSGKGNLVRQVEQFREMGAQVKKPISDQTLEESQEQGPVDAAVEVDLKGLEPPASPDQAQDL